MNSRDPKHAPGAPRMPFVMLLLGLVVGGLCALLALNTGSAANELQRRDLAASDQSVAAQVVQLKNEVAASAAPGNLAAAAARLGMVPAGNPAFVVIGADGQAHVLGSPAPVTGIAVAPPPTTSAAPHTSAARTTPAGHARTSTDAAQRKQKKQKPRRSEHADGRAGSTRSATPTPPTPTPNHTLPGGPR